MLWCVSDGTRFGVGKPLPPSRGWIYPHAHGRRVGNWRWQKRLTQLPWCGDSGLNSLWLWPLLACLAQWPGMKMAMARNALGEGGGGRKGDKTLAWLMQAGFVDRRKAKTKGPLRLGCSNRAMAYLCRHDGVAFGGPATRSLEQVLGDSARIRDHEDGVMDLVAQFMLAGSETAVGSRSWEHLGNEGGIKPDAMARLETSAYGATWYYIEYERSARDRSKIDGKLRGYTASRRRDQFPVLFVCYDEQAEQTFIAAGQDAGSPPMLTTTIERLEKYGALGEQCWRVYGEPARILPKTG